MEALKMPLLNVVKHMGMALCKPHAMTMGLADAFSVGKSSQLSTVCTEAHVPLAVFQFAHAEGLVHLHFGGMRMDVADTTEMRLYHEYLRGVELARSEHFRMVSVAVAADLSPNGYRHAAKPSADFSTQFYQGVHYRSMRVDYLEEQIELLWEGTPEEERGSVRTLTNCWLHNILRSRCQTWCYIEVGGGIAWNCGVLIKYNPDAFPPHVKPTPKAAGGPGPLIEMTPQPYKVAPLIEVYNHRHRLSHEGRCGSCAAEVCAMFVEREDGHCWSVRGMSGELGAQRRPNRLRLQHGVLAVLTINHLHFLPEWHVQRRDRRLGLCHCAPACHYYQ